MFIMSIASVFVKGQEEQSLVVRRHLGFCISLVDLGTALSDRMADPTYRCLASVTHCHAVALF